MDIFNVFTMVGGLALFLYGMHVLGEGLSKLSGGRMESILSKMTDSPLKGVLLGAGATAVIQSSSATTVMVVGFVNSGIMQLKQAVGIIMGANIGTTITSWILSLSGIKSDNLLVKLLKPEAFSPIVALIGIIFLMFCKSERKKDIGNIFLGFAVLMFGMETMSSAVEPLKDIPEFTNLFVAFSNPIFGMIAGTILTAVIQSSSASVGILQALCITGAIPYSAVLPIIAGQNIGTCITALLSSIGANINAKRAAFIHLYFNVIGTAVFMIAFYIIHYISPFGFLEQAATPAGIAVTHSFFNIFATILLLPFSYKLVKLATISVPEKHMDAAEELPVKLAALANMDKRFLDNPSIALTQCRKTTGAMLSLAHEAVTGALSLITDYSKKKAANVEELENYVDQYETKINDYMFEIDLAPLSIPDARELAVMQQCVGNIERVADYALSIVLSAGKMEKKNLTLPKEAKEDLSLYSSIISSLVKHTEDYWENPQPIIANDAYQLENELNRIEKRILKDHKKRLKKDKGSVDMGFILSDILTSLKKVAEHSLLVIDAMQAAKTEQSA
ncbi:MAG: Na/Pi cotransporter family protein [Lachnospiraceae bacterium]|nr:Na/Pi cotransporter family protein [Lachnospiraceae bacterium]